MTTKRKFTVHYRIRPLGLKMSQMLPSQIKLATVEVEALDSIDAISAFAKYAQGLNLEDTLRTSDFIEAVEVE